jgi:hypothetical protein
MTACHTVGSILLERSGRVLKVLYHFDMIFVHSQGVATPWLQDLQVFDGMIFNSKRYYFLELMRST